MDRRNVIWIVLLSVIPAGRTDICASCHANATCSSLPDGSGRVCICMYGFLGNGRTLCQDKDECSVGVKICGPSAVCHNTIGSYACTCLNGFSPSNRRISFTPNDGTFCRDVDECLRLPGVCGEGAHCVNLKGDFECRCVLGYRAHNATDPFQPLRDKGSCKAVDCGPPPAGEAVQVLSTTGTTYGSVVLMSCKNGFLWRQGDNSSTCGLDGTWSRPAPLCEEIQCGEPLSKPHARMLWDNSTRVGSVLHYQCEEGYRPSASTNQSVCGEHGQWEESDLRCEARCGPAPSLAHAEVVWYNSSMTVHRCANGYHSRTGGSVSVCGIAGQWQKATLKCIEVKPAVSDLRVLNEKCLQWRAEKENVDTEIYNVMFRGTREYQGAFRHERRQVLQSGDEWVKVCLSLLPATNYTISVIALSNRFTANITTNTSLQVPQAPLILYRELDAPPTTLRLQRSAHTLDAISVYQVVVVPLDGTVVFNCRSSQGDPPSGQYVTGQFPLSQMNNTEMIFTVGDGQFHGGFFNAPLKRGTNYYVILRVVSHWKEVFKCSCVLWAKVTGTSYVMRMSSLWAAGSVGVLLLLVLLAYGFSRRRDSPLNSRCLVFGMMM